MKTHMAARHLASLAAVALCGGAFADTLITGIDTAEKLRQALLDYKGSYYYIILEPGYYDVSEYSMPKYDISGKESASKSNLSLFRVNIRGKSGNPKDTVIYNSKGDNRIFCCAYGRLEHVTVSNGCANASNGGNGGGVLAENSSTESTNVIVTCCSATGNGGGVYSGTWHNCSIISNTAAYGGGAACDTSTGTMGSRGTKLDFCRVYNNVATQRGGGSYFGYAYNGTIVSNNVANSYGGGLYTVTATDSYIGFNRVRGVGASYGGGLYAGTATRCKIAGNAIEKGDESTRRGGGVSNTTCTDCEIVNNCVVQADAAGVYAGSLSRCVVSNNVPVPNGTQWGSGYGIVGDITLVNCDVYGSPVSLQCRMYNCRVQGYTNGYFLAEGLNVCTSGWFVGVSSLVNGMVAATNCLFAANRVSTLFECNKAATFSLVNCTVSSNCADNTFASFTGSYATANVVNTIISGNRTRNGSDARDMSFYSCGDNHLVFSHCLIGSARNPSEPAISETATVVSSSPKFDVDCESDPYSLSRKSPARRKGLVMDWMLSATDIRGDQQFPRSENGRVDIGCYQCWLPWKGALLFFR